MSGGGGRSSSIFDRKRAKKWIFHGFCTGRKVFDSASFNLRQVRIERSAWKFGRKKKLGF